MKEKLIFLFLPCLMSFYCLSAQTEVQLNANYIWGGEIQFVEGELDAGDDIAFNFIIQRHLGRERYMGLSYTLLATDINIDPNPFYEIFYPKREEGLDMHFIELTGTQNIGQPGALVNPFVSAGFGLAIYDIKTSDIEDRTRFLMSFGTGFKIKFTEAISANINAALKLPLTRQGTGIYCGFGTGNSNCGLSINSSVLVAHWVLGSGISYRF